MPAALTNGAPTEPSRPNQERGRRKSVPPGKLPFTAQVPLLQLKKLPPTAEKTVLAYSTVHGYSLGLQEAQAMHSPLRQHYRPKPDRVPAWLRRIWLWM
jgi:hypothetical protein